jgi:hypothetical protein
MEFPRWTLSHFGARKSRFQADANRSKAKAKPILKPANSMELIVRERISDIRRSGGTWVPYAFAIVRVISPQLSGAVAEPSWLDLLLGEEQRVKIRPA